MTKPMLVSKEHIPRDEQGQYRRKKRIKFLLIWLIISIAVILPTGYVVWENIDEARRAFRRKSCNESGTSCSYTDASGFAVVLAVIATIFGILMIIAICIFSLKELSCNQPFNNSRYENTDFDKCIPLDGNKERVVFVFSVIYLILMIISAFTTPLVIIISIMILTGLIICMIGLCYLSFAA